MTFISFDFFAFLAIAVICYYVLPLKYRWTVLLIASSAFYLKGGIEAFFIVLVIAFFSYFSALNIEKNEVKKKQKLILTISIVVMLMILSLLKISGNFKPSIDFLIVPVGISYFTLSIIGYLLDVYWKKDKAEKNFAHYLTFILFFPKIIQGPISRHKFLRNQLINGNRFDYKNVTFGMQLILWGVFKKIVLADRISIAVTSVYSDLDYYANGLLLIPIMILSAFELYLDFSGYTDIAIGISQMFGIRLEQNFNHPFFARSASEWWQRWHMTLSGWFKDYLFLPVSRSKAVKNFSKQMGTKFGASARKKTMMVISTATVWMATALWHGTGVNYLVWGLFWGSIIILSQLLESMYQKIEKALHINTESFGWKLFQRLRTGLIFVIGKMISAQSSLTAVRKILTGILTNTHLSDLSLLNELGLDRIDYMFIICGCLLVLVISMLQEKGIHIRETIAGWNPVLRWAFYSSAITLVLFFGLYGIGYDTSTFAYQFF